jgi:hypothetical protein
LDVTAQEIRSSLEATSAGALGQFRFGSAGATDGANFSLDIVVDIPTPFYFEAHTAWTGSAGSFNDATYRFYTPNSNEVDISFGSQPGMPASGSVAGVLLPGETYRLEFAKRGSATAVGPDRTYSRVDATASSLLIIPEPGSLVLLATGIAILLPFRRRMTDI